MPGLLRKVLQNQRRLGQGLASVLQHRHLTLFIDLIAPGLLAGLAVEEIDEHRLPVLASQLQHQRGLVGVAGFGEAMQLVVRHGRTLRWL